MNLTMYLILHIFQSTLPRGSDNNRPETEAVKAISIHAPSRERPMSAISMPVYSDFNPRSLAGATRCQRLHNSKRENFNPRSLAGATTGVVNIGK